MRVASMLSIGLLCTAFALPANAGVTAAGLGPVAGQAIIPIADNCPSGSQWVAPGYAWKGKWKDGHCSTWIPYQGYSAGYGQPAMPYGYSGGYGQPSPTEASGASQPSASSYPASDYGQP
jgi:hypothetical protein